MSWKLVLDPAAEPVSIDDLKANLRVDTIDSDVQLAEDIRTARRYVERVTERALLTQTWERRLDAFPAVIVLEKPPLQSVTSVQYVDPAGALQTLDPSKYTVNSFREPGLVYPAHDASWPATRWELDAVRIVYVAGWSEAAAVPPEIRKAIIRLASLWHREEAPVVTGTIVAELPFDVVRLLAPYRMNRPK